MKTVCPIDKCTGCMACSDVCPKKAIKLKDSLISMNAEIDEDLCIGCHLCENVCQILHPSELKKPMVWYQGWSADHNIRKMGASGGAASMLSHRFIENGGVVCSCEFSAGEFRFSKAETIEELKKFSGSKYVKSNPVEIYKTVRAELKQGKKVLFIGLPCQVSALYHYLGHKFTDELFTVDLICHGSPSVQLLDLFLKQHGKALNLSEDVAFRDKLNFQLICDGQTISPRGCLDMYTLAFLNGLTYTANCYNCHYAQLDRVSDITLGDSWGSDLPPEKMQKGVSLILCQTEKGEKLVRESGFELVDVNLTKAVAANHQLERPVQCPAEHDAFLNAVAEGKSFDHLLTKIYPKQCAKQFVKRILVRLHILNFVNRVCRIK